MKNIPEPIRTVGLAMFLEMRSYLGQSPFVYGCMQKALPSRRSLGLVDRDTQLCIEAPPGSGSSYFVNGFMMANQGVRLAHHQHVAAQVRRSVHFHTPALIILRNPVDCVVSRAWHSPLLAGTVFRQWIRFFRAVDKVRNSVLMASFESVIDEPNRVVEGINARFDTSFDVNFPEERDVFKKMDVGYSISKGEPDLRNPNRPAREKQTLKEQARPGIEAHEHASVACGIYEKLLARAI